MHVHEQPCNCVEMHLWHEKYITSNRIFHPPCTTVLTLCARRTIHLPSWYCTYTHTHTHRATCIFRLFSSVCTSGGCSQDESCASGKGRPSTGSRSIDTGKGALKRRGHLCEHTGDQAQGTLYKENQPRKVPLSNRSSPSE